MSKIDDIIKAADFHGHLGPFLVVGVRMGFIGLRELETTPENAKLRATIRVKLVTPFSCVIDGIQVATKCTVGNGKLQLKNSPETISANFKILEGKHVTVTLKPDKLMELKNSLPTDIASYETIKLARLVSASPEEELFTIQRK
jgi:formylmethanofuran dehydrogenase subunit E